MARHSKAFLCPSCGGTMKVSSAQTSGKVCCPHCRQAVIPENAPISPEISEEKPPVRTLPAAAQQLEEVLAASQQKRTLLTATQKELAALEARARQIGEWMETQRSRSVEDRIAYATLDLQERLFEQLLALPQGLVHILDGDPANPLSLARFLVRTFEAAGWKVFIGNEETRPSMGEEITFVVAPGPISYPVATLHMALQNSGVRLHSRISPDHPPDSASLQVHRISQLPKLLPASRLKPELLSEPLKKTA